MTEIRDILDNITCGTNYCPNGSCGTPGIQAFVTYTCDRGWVDSSLEDVTQAIIDSGLLPDIYVTGSSYTYDPTTNEFNIIFTDNDTGTPDFNLMVNFCEAAGDCINDELGNIIAGNPTALTNFTQAVETIINSVTEHVVLPDAAFADPCAPTIAELQTYLAANHANDPETNTYATSCGLLIKFVDGVASIDSDLCGFTYQSVPYAGPDGCLTEDITSGDGTQQGLQYDEVNRVWYVRGADNVSSSGRIEVIGYNPDLFLDVQTGGAGGSDASVDYKKDGVFLQKMGLSRNSNTGYIMYNLGNAGYDFTIQNLGLPAAQRAQMSFESAGGVTLDQHPETRDDTGAVPQLNVLYTGPNGEIYSAPFEDCCPDDSVTLTDTDIANTGGTAGSPSIGDVNGYVINNGPYNPGTLITYIGTGTPQEPEYVWYIDTTGLPVLVEAPVAVPADTNYANTNLTSDANRTHTWNHSQTENFFNAGQTINVNSATGQGAIQFTLPGYAIMAAYGPAGNAGNSFTETRADIGANLGKIIIETDFIEMFNDGGIYKLGLDPGNPNTVPRDVTNETIKNIVRDMSTGDMILQDLPSAHVIDDAFLTSVGGTPGAPTSNDINAWEVNNGQQLEGTMFIYIGNGTPQEPDYVWIMNANGAAILVQEPVTSAPAPSVSNDLGIGAGGDIEQGFPLKRNTETTLSGFDRRWTGSLTFTEIDDTGRFTISRNNGQNLFNINEEYIYHRGPSGWRGASTDGMHLFIDMDDDSADKYFSLSSNTNTLGSATEKKLFSVTEDGVIKMGYPFTESNVIPSPTGNGIRLYVEGESGKRDSVFNSGVADYSGVVLEQLDGASPKLGLDVATPLGYENSTGHMVPIEMNKELIGKITQTSVIDTSSVPTQTNGVDTNTWRETTNTVINTSSLGPVPLGMTRVVEISGWIQSNANGVPNKQFTSLGSKLMQYFCVGYVEGVRGIGNIRSVGAYNKHIQPGDEVIKDGFSAFPKVLYLANPVGDTNLSIERNIRLDTIVGGLPTEQFQINTAVHIQREVKDVTL